MSGATPASAPTAIPGAPVSAPSSTKPKRSKKKTTNPSAVPALAHLASAPSVNPDVIPGPAVAQAQAQAQAEDSVTVVPSVVNQPVAGSSKEKGPVEEVIAKRMRQLGKKLQRFRGYASRPHESLNADQKSAVASLPLLEGVYRELEDLSKQVEYVELEQAGKIREIREKATRDAEDSLDSKVDEFRTSLSTPLGLFLRLHALLHPARSSDHEHLTFARLELPSTLQDEVQATDVLRVGRMQEDLLAGGERGSQVLARLVKGPTGDDEENDHIHELLGLLSQADSYPADASAPEDAEEPASEPTPEVVEPVSKSASDAGLPNGHSTEERASTPPALTTAIASGGTLNFLQEDELAEESDEIVHQSMQTSGLQPPVEDYYAPASESLAEPATTQPDVLSSAPAEPTPHFDWAADEDMDEATEAAHIRAAFALPPSGTATPAVPANDGKIEEQVEFTEQGDVTAIVQENELANAHVIQGAEGVSAPTAVDSVVPAPLPARNAAVGGRKQERQRGRGRGRSTPTRGGNSGPQAHKLPAKPSTDEEGFQVVGRQVAGAGQAGRGDRGEAGRGRGGQNRGRGRPGPRGAGSRTASNGGTGEGQTQKAGPRPPRQPRQPSQAKQSTPSAPAAA